MLIPAEELSGRIEALQANLAACGIDAAVIVQNADLYYFSGSCQAGHLVIPAAGKPVYLVRKSLPRAREESALSQILPQNSFSSLVQTIQELFPGAQKIGMELDVLPANLYRRYLSALPDCELTDISHLIKKLRAVKSPFEISFVREAAKTAAAMFDAVPAYLAEGKSEIELAGELEAVLRKHGHQGLVRMRSFNQEVFYGHLMSGENLTRPSFFDGPTGGPGLSPAFPQGAGWKKIRRDEPVLVDYACVYHGYIVDKTRIFCLGSLAPKLIEAHHAALTVQNEVAKAAKPGAIWSDLYALALKVAAETGFAEHFMGYGSEKAGFIGHGVGLELDEYPIIAPKFADTLQEGMVFALEPKMFFPGTGVVGVENTFLVTLDGVEKLTSYPEDIFFLA